MLSEAGQEKTTPAKLRQKIRREAGILFHVTYVRKLMYRAGLSDKTATLVNRLHIIEDTLHIHVGDPVHEGT